MITQKRVDLTEELFKSGVGFEAMPLHDVVLPYAEADVLACAGVYQSQMADFEKEENKSLTNITDLMNKMLMFCVECEQNGIKISQEALDAVEREYAAEKEQIEARLDLLVKEVMGDTPINLASGQDMTKVIYSREIIDRERHIKTWNVGTDANGKAKFAPRALSKREGFLRALNNTTKFIEKTRAIRCEKCHGRGIIYKVKKSGENFKKPSKCPDCNGQGALFLGTGQIAGLQLNPTNPSYASANGFKTDKKTIQLLIGQARRKNNEKAVQFLTDLTRLNAVSVYLDSFVKGLKRWLKNGYAHPNLNQCITATGRLSSSNPNWQNMPVRGFPIRRAVVSRFENGVISETDYAGVEFKVCAALSGDKQALEDIKNGKDIHTQTACIIHQCTPDEVTKEIRSAAKAHSFAPLFGSSGYLFESHIKAYYDEFYNIYSGIAEWQDKLKRGVLKNGIVQNPSGRQYYWPDAKRNASGKVSYSTQIVNYPVQGFSADLMQLACIRALRTFQEHGMRSRLILTVHDSIVVDTHPDEIDMVSGLVTEAMTGAVGEAEHLWGYKLVVPLEVEVSTGKSWADCK